MIKVRVLSELKLNLPPQCKKVENDEDILLLDIFQKSDLDLLKSKSSPCIIFVKDAEFILEANANDYLICPFSDKELEIRIQIVLGKKDANLTSLDSLTGLYNKDHLYFCYEKLTKKALSILMIDLDCFKEVNDSQGHLKGDEVLKNSAKIFKHSIRNSDILARFGGDEFIIMLPDTPLDGAYVVGERICKAMEDECRVSVGVASLTSKESLEDLINKADKALYMAKKQGGNRVVKA